MPESAACMCPFVIGPSRSGFTLDSPQYFIRESSSNLYGKLPAWGIVIDGWVSSCGPSIFSRAEGSKFPGPRTSRMSSPRCGGTPSLLAGSGLGRWPAHPLRATGGPLCRDCMPRGEDATWGGPRFRDAVDRRLAAAGSSADAQEPYAAARPAWREHTIVVLRQVHGCLP